MKPFATGLIAAALLAGCLSGDDDPADGAPDTDAVEGNAAAPANANIIPLPEYTGISYDEMVDRLGAPVDKMAYTIGNAPTKTWNHGDLFGRYPKNEANNNVQITEALWDAGEYGIYACFHIVDGKHQCLVAKRIRKGVVF